MLVVLEEVGRVVVVVVLWMLLVLFCLVFVCFVIIWWIVFMVDLLVCLFVFYGMDSLMDVEWFVFVWILGYESFFIWGKGILLCIFCF